MTMRNESLEVLGRRVIKAMDGQPLWLTLPTKTRSLWGRYIRQAPAQFDALYDPLNLFTFFNSRQNWVNFLNQRKAWTHIYPETSAQQKLRIGRKLAMEGALLNLFPAGTTPTLIQEVAIFALLGMDNRVLDLHKARRLSLKELLLLQPWLIILT